LNKFSNLTFCSYLIDRTNEWLKFYMEFIWISIEHRLYFYWEYNNIHESTRNMKLIYKYQIIKKFQSNISQEKIEIFVYTQKSLTHGKMFVLEMKLKTLNLKEIFLWFN
jgi:hypothetical protein